MTLERLRRRAAQSDEQRDADGETSDDPETSIDIAEETESSGSRLGTITKTVGVAIAAATVVVAVRRLRRRRGE
ncbi:hypothetical protein ACFQDG_14970 [Natronoarchaeum mannanilyticum]|uniref:PGF-CTERM sorting domain-containing protein n=1 Tax=Natronoarchaeum mannanilyticum TaxID=926360 RepID=A0AAV3TCM1_9EURY